MVGIHYDGPICYSGIGCNARDEMTYSRTATSIIIIKHSLKKLFINIILTCIAHLHQLFAFVIFDNRQRGNQFSECNGDIVDWFMKVITQFSNLMHEFIEAS